MICAVFLLAITFFAIPESSHAGEYLPELFDNLLCYGLHGIMILAVAEISRRSQNGVGEPLFKSLPLILYIFGGIYLFVYATLETGNALEKYLPGFELGGISLLWGIAGLSTLVFGIRKNIPALRKTGILLFALSCIKVLLLDMAKVPMFWKIVCCSSVGLLLLIAAVIYIRQTDRFQNGN